jgi:glutathione S-transferase
MSLTLVIGTRRYSSWSLRPGLALKATGAAFATIEIALRQPDTKARILEHSPSGKVPVLTDGDMLVWDSLAICDHVAERFPQAGLWPDHAPARAMARSVSAEMHSGFLALRRDCPMDFGADLPLAAVPAEVAPDLARVDALWSACRQRFGAGGPFLFGRFSIADAMYAPVVSRCATYRLPLGADSAAYRDAVLALPALADWAAGRD